MKRRNFDFLGRARSAIGSCADRARRFGRGKNGIAAVEFALILPMMLALYFGCVVLAQGLDVGRKTQLLSRTLADLTAQQLTGAETSGNCATYTAVPCLLDTDLTSIFKSASQVMYPFSGATALTITEVIFDNIGGNPNGACCEAKVVWSVASGTGAAARPCGTLTQKPNGVNGPSYMPAGTYPTSVASGNTTDYYMIVADVTYTYSPGFGFQNNLWNQSANGGTGYPITMTTYMTPRNGATSPSPPLPAIQWTSGGTLTTTPTPCSYNTP